MLTRRQRYLLAYIEDYIDHEGVAPTFDEMMNHIDLKSKSSVHRLLSGIEERGFIRRLPNRARAIEIIKEIPGKK